MTPAELRQARMTLDLSQAELGVDLGLTEETIIGWEDGSIPIPRFYAQQVAWNAALKARADALEASGLPVCKWVEDFATQTSSSAKEQLRRAKVL